MDIKINSVSAINTLSASYYDPFFTYKQYRTGYEQGFNFTRIQALSGTVDSTINNYTSQYLTSKKTINDIFNVNSKAIKLKTLTTQLIFDTLDINSQPRYLYIYKQTTADSKRVTTCAPLLSGQIAIKNNTYFELEFLDDRFLRVKHNNGKRDYFLACSDINGTKLVFISKESEDYTYTSEGKDMFRYLIDSDGYLQLFKKTVQGNFILTLISDNIGLVPIQQGSTYRSSKNLIKINYNFKYVEPKTKSSWVSYDPKRQNDLIINELKSTFDRSDQFLLHANYNTAFNGIDLNYLTLNNQRSEKNYIKRGTNTTNGSPYVPDVEFRDYTSLQTGNNQEKGNDNIALTYVWYDKDIKVSPGSDTFFTTPSSLYPYEKININDTKFINNGSTAGRTPRLSDKFYNVRSAPISVDSGKYLCTWLSGSLDSPGTWVDRYYYPDAITRRQAMSSIPAFDITFDNVIDRIVSNNIGILKSESFFDKKSDVVLMPNTLYKYSRIGVDDIGEIVNASVPIASGFNGYYDTKNNLQPYSSNSITYDGERYNKFIVSDTINDKNSFTLSFEVNIDPRKSYGYQLLGNLTSKGFGVINDEQVTPFIYVYQNNKLKCYNTFLQLLYTTYFERDIKDIIKYKGLDDFLVICKDGYVYKLNVAGIKQKLEIINEIALYINYHIDESGVYFLLKDSKCIKIDRETLSRTDLPTKRFTSYDKYNPNFIPKGIVVYNYEVYLLPADVINYIDPDTIYYISNNQQLIKHDIRLDKITPFIESDSGQLKDIVVGPEDSVALIHGKNKFSIFSREREQLYTQSLSSSTFSLTGVGVDLVREYTRFSSAAQEDYIITGLDANNTVYLYKIGSNIIVNTGLSGLYTEYTTNSPNRYVATNFNYYKQLPIENKLNFNLTLTNYLSTEDIIYKDISFDYTNIDRGYHTFTYRFDSTQGNITLFVDGEKFINETVPTGKYGIQDIFSDDFYVGATGFFNGVDLGSYLKQPGYYFAKDLTLKNLFIYDRPLSDEEVLAINIFGKDIDEIVLSIPAGQRNNIEEIERYFKFSPINSNSKKINIYIKNAGINNEDLKNNIKALILRDAASMLPVGVGINDIQFLDFI